MRYVVVEVKTLNGINTFYDDDADKIMKRIGKALSEGKAWIFAQTNQGDVYYNLQNIIEVRAFDDVVTTNDVPW